MPCDYSKYPPNWKTEIRPKILERENHKCKFCQAENYKPHPVTGSKVILTIAHLDHDLENNCDNNLAALCQRCHLNHDKTQHAITRRKNKDKKKGQKWLFNPKTK